MKRLYIAVALLAAVAGLCVITHLYQHRKIDQAVAALDRIEAAYRGGDTEAAVRMAEDFAADYERVSNRVSCYVPHGELRESRETAALLPALMRAGNEDELYMEIARLRSQLRYLRQVDDPILQNIL